MVLGFSRRVLVVGMALSAVLALGSLSNGTRPVSAAPQAAAVVTVNPFHGTYKGGYWGTVPGVGPYGGDVSATVTTAGKVTLTLPGAGTGTVSPTGAYSVTGKLTVKGLAVNVTYTGKLVATKHPTTGAYLTVVGSGTWKTTTGVIATGSWLVQRTATTP